MALDRDARVEVNKLAAILRLANALDADHLQKVKDVRLLPEEGDWVLEVEGAGDLTMERLASLARADYLTEVFGRKVDLPRDAGAAMAVTAARAKRAAQDGARAVPEPRAVLAGVQRPRAGGGDGPHRRRSSTG